MSINAGRDAPPAKATGQSKIASKSKIASAGITKTEITGAQRCRTTGHGDRAQAQEKANRRPLGDRRRRMRQTKGGQPR